MNQQEKAVQFLELSVVLTGFQKVDLQGTGLVEAYCSEVTAIVGEEITGELLTLAASIIKRYGGDESALETAIRMDILASRKLGPVARNITKLWYLGTWNRMPADWRSQYGVSPKDEDHILSALSYEESLVWRAMGSNPQGAKQPGFGTWSLPPRQESF
jgi:hypothetical protein